MVLSLSPSSHRHLHSRWYLGTITRITWLSLTALAFAVMGIFFLSANNSLTYHRKFYDITNVMWQPQPQPQPQLLTGLKRNVTKDRKFTNSSGIARGKRKGERPLESADTGLTHGNATVGPHKIPHRTIFIHTLFRTPEEMGALFHQNILNTHTIFSEAWNEPHAPMWFLGDKDCIEVIKISEPALLEYYIKEPRGNKKANICRVAALYLKGGYYFDVDMVTVNALPLPPDTTFSSPREYETPGRFVGLFNSFLATTSHHPILRTNLDIYLRHYSHPDEKLPVQSMDHHMGTGTLRMALDRTPEVERGHTFLNISESHLSKRRKAYPNVKSRDGIGCCCDFFVEDPVETKIYFWSRIPGSGNLCQLPVPR